MPDQSAIDRMSSTGWNLGASSPNHPFTSVIVVNYNGSEYISACLTSLINQDYANFEILLVDNGSTDNSLELVRQNFPSVRIVQNTENLGYSGAVNLAASKSSAKYISVLNMDVVVEPDWLHHLVSFLENNPNAGAVNPLILLADRPDTINALGQNVHVTGLGFNRMLNYPRSAADVNPRRVSGLQGAALVMPRELFAAIGGMNQANFMYHEDVDVSWLINMVGYDIYCVPESVVYHDYSLGMKAWKYYYLERNRWALMLCVYDWVTLAFLVPFFLLTEAMMIAYCLRSGKSFLMAKRDAIVWNWQNRERILSRRERIQAMRQCSDRHMLGLLRFNYDWDQLLHLAR